MRFKLFLAILLFTSMGAMAQAPPPSLAELKALIERHGPLIKLHINEAFLPDDPTPILNDLNFPTRIRAYEVFNESSFDSFFTNAYGDWGTSSNTLLQDVQPLLHLGNVSNSNYRYLLDYSRATFEAGNLSRAKVYVRVQPYLGDDSMVDLQFWIFYPWNGPGKSLVNCGAVFIGDFDPTGTANQHYSDWENIRVRVARDPSGGSNSSVVNVKVSRHASDEERPASNVTFNPPNDPGGHPVIYSAKDSHAHYFAPGRTIYETNTTDLLVCDLDVDLYDLTSDGGPELDASDPGKYMIVSSAWPNVATTTPDWFFFGGQWGEYQPVQFCIDLSSIPGLSTYCPAEAQTQEKGKPGLLRRAEFDVPCAVNANLGSLRFIEERGSAVIEPVPSLVGTLTPAFDPQVTNYELALDGSVQTLRVMPQAADNEALIEVSLNGFPFVGLGSPFPASGPFGQSRLGASSPDYALSPGSNTFEFRVTVGGTGGTCALTTKTYTVTIPDCRLDAFEPDDNPYYIGNLGTTAHSICGIGDEDWVFLDLGSSSGRSSDFFTSGTSSQPGPERDTLLTVYDLSGNVIAEDDNGGDGDFSRIFRPCGNALPQQIVLRVKQATDSALIEDYSLSLNSSVACPTCRPLSLSHSGSGGDPSTNPGGCETWKPLEFRQGQVIALNAAPAAGWVVESWSGTDDDTSVSTSNTLTMPGTATAVSVTYRQLVGGTVVSSAIDGAIGSLRDVITNAPPDAVITFDPSLDGGVLTLTAGEIELGKNLTIDASALPGGLTISGNNASRVFRITGFIAPPYGPNVTLKGLTITEGFSSGNSGGCIANSSDLTLIDTTVTGCTAGWKGGGLSISGVSVHRSFTTNFVRSTVSNNHAIAGGGGGIYNSSGNVILTNSTVSGNLSPDAGSGILNRDTLKIVHSTISGNRVGAGQGTDLSAIWESPSQCTTPPCLIIENSIIAGNEGRDIYIPPGTADPSISVRGENFIGNNDTVEASFPAGPLVGTATSPLDPSLNPLGDFGGPTATMPPLPGSTSIDAAIATADSPATDQRGALRPDGPFDDIGAVEGAEVPGPDELVSDFGDRGLWQFSADTWSRLSTWDATQVAAWGKKLAAGFGEGRGLWLYESGGWMKLTSWDPTILVPWGDKLAVGFGSGRGLWTWGAGGWEKLTSWDPTMITVWGDKLAVGFGMDRGTWTHDGSWNKLTSWDPATMIAWGTELVVGFDLNRGTWANDGGGWNKLSSWDAETLEVVNDTLAADFGDGRGLWERDTGGWDKLTSWDAEAMQAWDGGLAVDFGDGRGLWLNKTGGWSRLTTWDPVELDVVGTRLFVAFGSGRGLWNHDTIGWSRLTPWDSEQSEAVDLD